MRKLTYAAVALMLGAFVVSTTSCEKRKANRETTSAEDNDLAESLFDDLLSNVEESQGEELEGEGKTFTAEHTFGDCATVTIDGLGTGTWPKTLTIDFGSTNCTGDDNKNRRGSIVAVYSGPYREAGSSVTITPTNYHVNDHHVEGLGLAMGRPMGTAPLG